MDRFDRILTLHKILSGAKVPVSGKQIEEKLECSKPTRHRIIEDMRVHLNAPIVYERERNGFFYDANTDEGRMFELPGLWFNATELHGLLVMREMLSQIQPGLFEAQLSPIAKRIDKMLEDVDGAQSARRVRIHGVAMRDPGPHFEAIAGAAIGRQRIHIRYCNRSTGQMSEREVSPQRMIHYRDNWYLDGWCHLREELRTFAIEQVVAVVKVDAQIQIVADQQLDEHYARAYGIFAGPKLAIAVLRFSPQRARWVAKELWHPEQQGEWLEDGCYVLRLPYGNPTELIMDILRHGPEVEVLEPAELRAQVLEQLKLSLAQYRQA